MFSVSETWERTNFCGWLQDISQPKSEVTPPDGLLAVPLLRHQVTLQVHSFKFFHVVFFKKFLQVIGAFSFPIPI